jgi:MoxR-like ATPase
VLGREEILEMQKLVRRVPVARHVQDYAIRILESTHPHGAEAPDSVKRYLRTGASPRGAQSMLLAAKIRALFEGRFAASVDDVKVVALPALRHRILMNFEGEAEGVGQDAILGEILKQLPAARE